MTYTFAAPNFCGKCGTKLTASLSASPKEQKKPVRKNTPEEEEWIDDDEEFSSSDEIPALSCLAYDLENDSSNRQYQFGELFGQRGAVNRSHRAVSLDDFKERHGKK